MATLITEKASNHLRSTQLMPFVNMVHASGVAECLTYIPAAIRPQVILLGCLWAKVNNQCDDFLLACQTLRKTQDKDKQTSLLAGTVVKSICDNGRVYAYKPDKEPRAPKGETLARKLAREALANANATIA